MKGILYYDSKYGTTKAIAEWIKEELTDVQVDMLQITDSMMVRESYDFVILGTPIYVGKPRQDFIQFVKRNKEKFPKQLFLFIVTWAASTSYKEKTEGFLELIRFYLEPAEIVMEASLPGKLYLDKVSKRDCNSMMRILHRLDLLSDEFDSKNMTFTDKRNEAESRNFGECINEYLKKQRRCC